MKRLVVIEINSGDRTCFNFDTQEWCPHIGVKRYGTRYLCGLFRIEEDLLDDVGNLSGSGPLQRWPECLMVEITSGSK